MGLIPPNNHNEHNGSMKIDSTKVYVNDCSTCTTVTGGNNGEGNNGNNGSSGNIDKNDDGEGRSRKLSMHINTQHTHEEVLPPMTKEDKLENLNLFFEELFNSIDYTILLIFMGE